MSDNPIASRWQFVRSERRAALIPYLTAGFPTYDTSLAALRMLPDAGADIVEVGIPFSDPLADGPVIQRSTQVSLDGGMTLRGTLDLVCDAALDVPVIAFGYLNPILKYGLARFLEDARAAGVSGLLLTDLPAGEDADIERAVHQSSIDLIKLIAPTTAGSRIEESVVGAEGFLYLISRLGVTGPRTTIGPSLEDAVIRVRRATSLPIAIGFGITNGSQAAEVARIGDGVVVGSALVRCLEDGLDAARALMEELYQALRSDGDRRG